MRLRRVEGVRVGEVKVRWSDGHEETHTAEGREGRRIVTRDNRGKRWTWLTVGVCCEDARARLVDPKEAAKAAGGKG